MESTSALSPQVQPVAEVDRYDCGLRELGKTVKVSSRILRIVLSALSVGPIAAANLASVWRLEDRNATSPQVVREQARTRIENPTTPTQTSSRDSTDATAFASIAEREISQLDKKTTLAQWLILYGKDERWVKSTDPNGLECLRLVKRGWLPSGAILAQAVYFYPPPAPSPAILPALTGQALINSACTLGMVRVEAQARAEELGRTLAQAVRQEFTKNYGEGVGMKSVPFWGRGYYDADRWIPNAEIVSGYDPKRGRDISTPDEVVGGPVAFVHARLPTVHELEHEACCSLPAFRYRFIDNSAFHHAVDMAGVDAALSGQMQKLYEEFFLASDSTKQAQQPGNPRQLESLIPVLREWLTASKASTPVKRAAGLLAADLFIAGVQDSNGGFLGDPKNPQFRSEMEQLGAVFQLNEIAGWYFYTRNWSKQAQEFDPNGKVGEMALLVSLARPSCDFRNVLLDGERLLAKGLDAPTSAQVHFIVGDAYSDIVAIAGGAETEGEYDLAELRNEAVSARAKAFEHYRAGLAGDATSESAKDAWRQAWHLSAGLLPRTRNVCIGD